VAEQVEALEHEPDLATLAQDDPIAAFLEPIAVLAHADAAEMLTLAEIAKPGPFGPNTVLLGNYWGIRHNGRLIAMAGERLRLDGFTEISAVCTASEFRGQGLGRTLVEALSSMLLSEGRTPFLHVKTENGAKQLYERIGFRVRRQIRLTVISRSS